MGPKNGINLAEVNYFSIEEYIERIKLKNYVLEHMEETNQEFDKYLKQLSKYDKYSIVYLWINSLSQEITSSQQIENEHFIPPQEIEENDIFFDTLLMSHNRIKHLHQFVTKSEKIQDYRDTEVRVSRMTPKGEEIFWRGVQSKDVKLFMDDFISFYKSNSLSVLYTNPFFKSALAHLLFVRIHPFTDGNGRTARMIHNIKFTESINKIYGMNLKICPLNLSQNILINRPTYAKTINNIYFDLEHDSNDEINAWLNFILNMVDEQLYFNINRLPQLEKAFYYKEKIQEIKNKQELETIINKTKIKSK